MKLKGVVLLVLAASTGFASLLPGCSNNENKYKPVPAWSGRKVNLPAVPTLPSTPIKNGDAYTVYGAIHQLNSEIHSAEVTSKEITVVGYIVDSNMDTVDPCALHPTGKKDPDGCTTQIPSFTLADAKGDKSSQWKVRVMGWASNFANVFDAWKKYKDLKKAPDDKDLLQDELWAVPIPYPLPAIGAKVKVTGKYGVNFSKSSNGVESDPLDGIITYSKIEVLEDAPEPVSFPQLKKK